MLSRQVVLHLPQRLPTAAVPLLLIFTCTDLLWWLIRGWMPSWETKRLLSWRALAWRALSWKACCPRFLEEEAFEKLKVDLASDELLLIRTTAFVEELRKRRLDDIDVLCAALRDQVKPGGRVIWRSASRSPKNAECIAKAGFDVVRITTSDKYMDRVKTYASFYVGIRQGGPSREATSNSAGTHVTTCWRQAQSLSRLQASEPSS